MNDSAAQTAQPKRPARPDFDRLMELGLIGLTIAILPLFAILILPFVLLGWLAEKIGIRGPTADVDGPAVDLRHQADPSFRPPKPTPSPPPPPPRR